MHTGSLRVRLLVSCVFLVACSGARAQLLTPKQDSVYSNVLKQNRAVEVYLPKEFDKDAAQRYETLYVLDGDGNTQIVASIVTFMRESGLVPPVILVSVPNVIEDGVNSRDHDLTPTVVADQPRSGGAADFLSFLKTELVPYIDQRYPTDHVHLIHGHSYGGLFLMYTLLHEPALFDGYLILDPSMWWDKHVLDAVIDEKLADVPAKGKAIYIAARSGRAFESMGMSTIEPIFQRKSSPKLHWQITAYPDESHGSIKLKGTYDALRFVYRGYTAQQIELVPTGGIVIKGKPVFLSANGDADRFLDLHYSTDGSEPSAASPKVDGPLAVSDPEKTQIKLLLNRGIFDRAIPHGLKSGTVLPPSRATKNTDTWHVSFYPAEAWENFRRSKAFKTFDTEKEFGFADAGRDTFAGIVERNLDIPAEGYYVFGVQSSNKVRLSVAGRPLIEHDGAHGEPRQAFIVPLQRGVYRVRLEFQRAANTPDVSMVVFQCKDDEPEWWKNELFKVSSRK
jgi:predicted alpha/beta superfamily hydrolase